MKQFKNQKGMTLLEVIIVLGIMGIIAAGVVVLAQRAIDNQNATKLTQALNSIQTAMVQTYRGQPSYPKVEKNEAESAKLSAALIAMGKVSAEDMRNPYNGDPILVFTHKFQTRPDRAFAVRVSGLNRDQCSSIVSSTSELFSFVQVERTGGALTDDAYAAPNANATTGIIKSTFDGGENFDITNITHITNLCGGTGASSNDYYDVFVGNR
ncbi:MAG: type IV pilus major pilin [Vibrio sp.]